MTFIRKKIYSLLIAASIPVLTYADTGMNFKGNLVIPQCTINGNVSVEVDFSDVEIQTLTAKNTAYHIQPLNIPVDCPYTLGSPKITLNSSSVADANKGSIQTSKYSEGLVVYVLKKDGSTAIPLGKASDISDSMSGTGKSKTLLLNAGLGRTGELEALTPGKFSASATLAVIYQ